MVTRNYSKLLETINLKITGGGIGRRRMVKLTARQSIKHMDYTFAEREAVSCTVSRKGLACKVQILTL